MSESSPPLLLPSALAPPVVETPPVALCDVLSDSSLLPNTLAKSLRALRDVPGYYCCRIEKWNPKGRSQRRILILLHEHLYTCDEAGDIKRCIPLRNVRSILCGRNGLFGICVEGERDLLLTTPTPASLLENLLTSGATVTESPQLSFKNAEGCGVHLNMGSAESVVAWCPDVIIESLCFQRKRNVRWAHDHDEPPVVETTPPVTLCDVLNDSSLLPNTLAKSLRALRDVPGYYCCRIEKWNPKGRSQRRILILLHEHLYTCDEKGDIKRCVPIPSIRDVLNNSGAGVLGLRISGERDILFFTRSSSALLGRLAVAGIRVEDSHLLSYQTCQGLGMNLCKGRFGEVVAQQPDQIILISSVHLDVITSTTSCMLLITEKTDVELTPLEETEPPLTFGSPMRIRSPLDGLALSRAVEAVVRMNTAAVETVTPPLEEDFRENWRDIAGVCDSIEMYLYRCHADWA